MIDPFVELGGWIIAQAMSDVLGKDEVDEQEQNDAWNFLLHDPLIDHVLDHIDYGVGLDITKREYIVRIIIPQKAVEYANQPNNITPKDSRALTPPPSLPLLLSL